MSQSSSASDAAARSSIGGDTFGNGPVYNVGAGAGAGLSTTMILAIAAAALLALFIWRKK